MVRWGAERRRIKPQRGLDRETTTPDLPHGSITRCEHEAKDHDNKGDSLHVSLHLAMAPLYATVKIKGRRFPASPDC